MRVKQLDEKQRIRVLIIEDEVVARERIRRMLQSYRDFEVIGEFDNGPAAIRGIMELNPNLVFLDVQMPGMDGFQMLHELEQDSLPYIIFVTAHDQYALSAFEVYALDYILKPFDEDRFKKTIEHARKQIHQKKPLQGVEDLLQEIKRSMVRHLERFVIKRDGRLRMIPCNQVDFLQAEGKYVRLHIGNQSHLIRVPISYLEDQLNPKHFVRIHRSYIVNIERISELQLSFHGDYKVLLNNGEALTLSRGYREKVSRVLGWSV